MKSYIFTFRRMKSYPWDAKTGIHCNLDAFQHPTAYNVASNVVACAMFAMGVKKKADLILVSVTKI